MKKEQDYRGMASVRPPIQRRSRDKLERILTATETLFAMKGPQATTIQDIIEKAGCSVGAFYQRFPDRETLVAAVLARFEGTVKAEIGEAFDEARLVAMPLYQMVSEVVDFVFRLFAGKEEQFRAFTPLSETYPFARQSRIRIITFATTKLGDVLMLRRIELAHPDPMLAASIIIRMLIGVLDSRRIHSGGKQEDDDIPLEIIQAELKRNVQLYLGIHDASSF